MRSIARTTTMQNSEHRFVLTHSDLSDYNIMVFKGIMIYGVMKC